jgi:hypothetical protein
MAQPEQGTGAIAPDETVSCFDGGNASLAFSLLTFTSLTMAILLLYVHNFQTISRCLKANHFFNLQGRRSQLYNLVNRLFDLQIPQGAWEDVQCLRRAKYGSSDCAVALMNAYKSKTTSCPMMR